LGSVSRTRSGSAAAVIKSVVAYALFGSLWVCVIATVVVMNVRGYGYAKRLVARMGSAVELT
jgi:hypothetical protein